MNTTNWEYYYKLDPVYLNRCESNMLYAPKVAPDKSILCMHYDYTDNIYQKANERNDFTEGLVDFFFQREVHHLNMFKDYSWCPKVYDINMNERKIFIEWVGETCNDYYEPGRTLNELPDWKEQLYNILSDILDAGYYKMSLYPHCFFIKDGVLKTFDFYACLLRSERYLDINILRGMMGNDSAGRFSEATVDNKVDFEYFFKRILSTHVKWPEDPFPEFYKRLFDANV